MLFSDKYTNLENLNCGWSNFGSDKRAKSSTCISRNNNFDMLPATMTGIYGKKNSIESSILVFRFSLMKLMNP